MKIPIDEGYEDTKIITVLFYFGKLYFLIIFQLFFAPICHLAEEKLINDHVPPTGGTWVIT